MIKPLFSATLIGSLAQSLKEALILSTKDPVVSAARTEKPRVPTSQLSRDGF